MPRPSDTDPTGGAGGFSRRTPAGLAENRLAAALADARAAGDEILDLAVSNPTVCGIRYPEAEIARALADAGAGAYEPSPRGIASARRAVAGELARRGLCAAPESIFLTASTSEAYGLLFKLLADPGDEVLLPRPSYPLLEHLAALEGVRPVSYSLAASRRFALDPDRIEAVMGERTRAVVVVSPHNPTGAVAGRAQLAELGELCGARGVAVIGDEVFADYAAAPPPSLLEARGALRFGLGGLSKSIGLPQLKLSWIAIAGPRRLQEEAAERLEFIADAYLSVSSPIQRALPRLLSSGADVRAAIAARTDDNRRAVAAAIAGITGARVASEPAGWHAVVELPDRVDEEALVTRLLQQDRVFVHPGYFFDFERDDHVVVSLLTPPERLGRGLERLVARIRELA